MSLKSMDLTSSLPEESPTAPAQEPDEPVYMYNNDIKPKCSPIGIFASMPGLNVSTKPVDSQSILVNSSFVAKPLRIDVNNDDLCFFGGIVSCPSSSDLRKITSVGSQTGRMPKDKAIIAALASNNVDNNVVETIPIRPKKLELEPHLGLIHADGGASISLIRASIARQLGTPIITLDEAVPILDINDQHTEHKQICYVQLEMPGVAGFRAIVMCLVKENCHLPFLLGANDQAAYHINPQPDTRQVRIGAPGQATKAISFLEPKR